MPQRFLHTEAKEIDQKWTGIFTTVSSQGAISYFDVKRLDVFEFFLMFDNYVKEKKNARK